MKRLSLIVFTILSILIIPLASQAVDPFTVRTIYFIPADKQAKNNDISKIMLDVQRVYQDEMDKHGFGEKTFKLEINAAGNVIVHKINAANNAAHYAADTINNTYRDLPLQFKQKHYAYIIIIAGMQSVQHGKYGGIAAVTTSGDVGFAFIAEDAPKNITDIIEHEAGHTFGLIHNFIQDGKSYIMGPGNDVFHEQEARWLSKSHYLNDHHIVNNAPTIKTHPLENAPGFRVKIKYDITDADGLHQIQVKRVIDRRLLDWKYLDGNTQTIIIEMNRDKLEDGNELYLYVMDDFGNYAIREHQYVLPPEPEPKPEA